jgi:hypothetical protein
MVCSARVGVEGGSYGGQLDWLITRTNASRPRARGRNRQSQSFNYMSYYQDDSPESGAYPHEKDLMDTLYGPVRRAVKYRDAHSR